MLHLKTNGKNGQYDVNIPTSLDEITKEYIDSVVSQIVVAPNYSLIGVVFKEKLSTLLFTNKNKKDIKGIPVIPIFIKAGETDDSFIHNINFKDTLIISDSDIMMGHHVSCPKNVLTLSNVLSTFEGDQNIYRNVTNIKDNCYFISFKIVPNCNIHGHYDRNKTNTFVNPFILKTANAENNVVSKIILPD